MLNRSDLRQHLNQLQDLDRTEQGHRDAVLALLDLPGDVASRSHFDPGHLTASAFVLSPDHQELLLILHGKLHMWLQPGGHVDADDPDLVVAAQREVAEETGVHDVLVLNPLFDVDVHVIPARKGDPEHRHYDVRVLLQAATKDMQAGSDAADARWVRLTEVAELNTDESVRRAVGKILKRQK